jgi:hypothetical protein
MRRLFSHWARRSSLPPLPSAETLRSEFLSHASKVLSLAKEQLPEHALYRSAITQLYQHRMQVVAQPELSVSEIETQLGAGPMFELIEAAKDEHEIVIPLLAKEKPWEMQDDDPAYKEEDPDFVPWERKVLVE